MKYKNAIITLIVIMLVVLLQLLNIYRTGSELANPLIIILIIGCFSFSAIYIQKDIDKNYQENNHNYKNLNILKYFAAVLIVILHLRPFINISDQLDLVFNNIITRICVPIFFLISGYFVAKKEKSNPNYIKEYIKKNIPLYLIWSLVYIPVILAAIVPYLPTINEYISRLNITLPALIILLIVVVPIVLIIALIYTGVYYHLWYFPALFFSLLILKKWNKKFNVKYLLVISFVLLLFGATETYYGILPMSIKGLLSYYYTIFFTTRNFLFFGLFYVVLGYYMGLKDKVYSKYCFEKVLISVVLLIFESSLLHDTDNLNSNILISCVPLTYYLFSSTIYLTNNSKSEFQFSNLSKYYYLIHPMIIFIISLLFQGISKYPYLNIFSVLIVTHVVSIILIKLSNRNKKSPLVKELS